MIEGEIVASCLKTNDQTEYYEFSVREVPKRGDEKEESKENAITKAEIKTIHLNNNNDSWIYYPSYPLVACINTTQLDMMIIAHIANG